MCVIGTIAPYAVFVPWLMQHGLDLALLLEQASGTAVAAFAWLDVLVSALVVLALAARRILAGEHTYWFVVAGTCMVGVSLGLPLYLYLREEERAAWRVASRWGGMPDGQIQGGPALRGPRAGSATAERI